MAAQKVVISKDLKADLQAFFASMSYDRLFLLTDTNTQEKCYPLIKDIPALQDAPVITVQAGDTHKDIEQVAYIWSRLSNEGASRNSLLVNLGGGMITDMGGFAGATFKRGLRTVNIPTTLMASVDAAVGGKTGVNFNGLKNEVGSFYPPECVFIDCAYARSGQPAFRLCRNDQTCTYQFDGHLRFRPVVRPRCEDRLCFSEQDGRPICSRKGTYRGGRPEGARYP